MKLQVDEALCSGNGQCAKHAPEIFQLDDDGYCKQLGEEIEVAEGQEGAAQEAANACPESAISILEE